MHSGDKCVPESDDRMFAKVVGDTPIDVLDVGMEIARGGDSQYKLDFIATLNKLSGMTKEDGLMLLKDVSREYELAMEELKEAHLGFRKEMVALKETSTEALSDLRSKRYALITETKTSLGALKDVRQFFLDKDFESERDRLESFVTLCERLKVLQESGFLDVVSDTMLKLSE